MLDWLGDVTSTVRFCQLSEGVCYPTNLCANFHVSYGPIEHMTVYNYTFVSF